MCRILLVDDEHLERKALEIIIKSGISQASIIGQAESGDEAVKLCNELKPDMIFMDIKIPGINGIEASKIIKEKYPQTIIFILTAYDEFDFAHKAVKIGIDDYILKPAKPEEIISIIKKYEHKVKHRESIVDVQKLSNSILSRKYNDAKTILKEVLDNIEENQDENERERIKKAAVVADKMIEMSTSMGLKKIHPHSYDTAKKFSQIYEFKKARIELTEILDIIFEEIVDKKLYDRNDEMNAIVNYVEKNYQNRISLEEVADYVNLNPQYLSRLVKKELGIGFSNYVTNLKIEKAKELLLETDMPVLNISLELSYNEPNYFCRVFKKIVGMTPMEYRASKLQ
ncbi:response regulator transcription factor [Geosporobacter ferrireducens]|uniref:Stage 0 sporulation protein A homolog n=1 Tax=Geosporobacter ferrireducens TaxID=1424294 RepID=A0A1D8GKB3_9FIRM|nr:response regulator [Geosporobacter ferrireducens]AOT71347.1 hypothetical protein Gferi_18380 [Geosporobacter ferrireducens]MTI57660.1 response regulator [Geosporobacter ferrireducens]